MSRWCCIGTRTARPSPWKTVAATGHCRCTADGSKATIFSAAITGLHLMRTASAWRCRARAPCRPGDKFKSPFPNANAARAGNNGALPPDLSLMVKARKDGANYLHALMTGYREAPKDFELGEGMNYNAYFPGNQIAMPAPISDDGVEYADGTKATVDQMSRDLTTFLAWTAEPEMEERASAWASRSSCSCWS